MQKAQASARIDVKVWKRARKFGWTKTDKRARE